MLALGNNSLLKTNTWFSIPRGFITRTACDKEVSDDAPRYIYSTVVKENITELFPLPPTVTPAALRTPQTIAHVPVFHVQTTPDHFLQQTLDAVLSSKAERADLASIEASAASLLALSRERAATAAHLESDLCTTTTETTALRQRVDGHDQALAKLKTGVAQQSDGCRETFERRARGLEKRVRRAEEGLAMVVAEVGARVTEVTRRCR